MYCGPKSTLRGREQRHVLYHLTVYGGTHPHVLSALGLFLWEVLYASTRRHRTPMSLSSTLLMVSGASRGLGRAIATAFATSPLLSANDDTVVEAVLLARSSMTETRRVMQAARPAWHIHEYSIDLSNLETLQENVDPILDRHAVLSSSSSSQNDSQQQTPDRAILINCAGTTGYIGRLPTSLQEIKQAADLNFTSKAWLTSRFVETFPRQSTVVVNVSSMCAVKPTPTMALYCATSAAREMYHTVLAMDCMAAQQQSTTANNDNNNNDHHNTSSDGGGPRILNYAPGSCDTDMQAHLRCHANLDPAVQAYCQGLVTHGGLVDVNVTAAELVRRVLQPDGFGSGQRIEFVDGSTYKY